MTYDPVHDFAVGGCLKWLCGGPGNAFLYTRPDVLQRAQPAFTGWFSRAHPFEFDIDGGDARDDAMPERLAGYARKHTLPFPLLKDPGNVVADRFGARRTPEAFVLDGERRIRYQGRIDDQFGLGFQRTKANRDDLTLALADVLAGRKVAEPTTAVAGCLISRGPKAAELTPPPNTAAASDLPGCNKTNIISTRQAII